MAGARVEVQVTAAERETLERWARRPKSSQALALRCRIVLAAADGESSKEIAARLGCNASTVGRWRGRFARMGLDGLHDEQRPGQPRKITDDDVERVIVKTLEETPANATHWSTRSMAAASGLNQTAIVGSGGRSASNRIWSRTSSCHPTRNSSTRSAMSSGSISTRRTRRWCYAWTRRPRSKPWIGPLRSCRFCPGQPSGATHDYVRNGTTNLYAALDVASGRSSLT